MAWFDDRSQLLAKVNEFIAYHPEILLNAGVDARGVPTLTPAEYAAFLSWAHEAGLLTDDEHRHLLVAACQAVNARDPRQ